jgi:hypothetical protein
MEAETRMKNIAQHKQSDDHQHQPTSKEQAKQQDERKLFGAYLVTK